MRTVTEAINQMAGTRGDATFLLSPETGRTLTFVELQSESKTISSRLRRAGLDRGDKVAFLMDNGLFTIQLFLGTMYGGLVVVPLNVRAGAAQLAYTLDHCDAKVVFVEEQYVTLLREVLAGINRRVELIRADVDAFSTEVDASSDNSLIAEPGPDELALLMYTSGSVGMPKAAMHSHATLLAHGRNSICSHRLTSADRSLLVLPLYHINAECVTLMPTLLSGGSVVVPHHFNVSKFWDWLDEYRCTWSAVVPTIISQLLDWKDPHADRRADAFHRIRFIRSSSAPLSPSLQREFLDKFKLLLIQAMGSSEAGNIFSNPLPPGENKIGTPGLAWGFETRIIDPAGVDVPAGEPGEVLIRGAAVTQGYYKDTEQSAAVLDANGWLHTGDLAYQDNDGYFFVIGRSKELIIKGGMNIAPRQIDEVLESHPAVLEAAVVGVPDHYLGEDLVAFAVLRSGVEGDEREMLSFCESRLGHFKTPTRIHFVADLPKGPSGKVQRLRLLNEAGQVAVAEPTHRNGRVAQGSAPVAPDTRIEGMIAKIWIEVLGKPQIGPDTNFFVLGGDSLTAIRCLSAMRQKLPVMLSLSDFFENPTVAQQAIVIAQRLSAANLTLNSGLSEKSHPQEVQEEPRVISTRGRNLPYRLSSGQQRIWFFEDFAPGVPLYNESETVRLTGELQAEALEQALNVIIDRHEILRTTFQIAAERPIGIVHEKWPLRMKRLDLSAMSQKEREAEVERLLIDEPRSPYHLEKEPGIRSTLVRLSPTEHVFILMMHHMVCDWASEGVLWRELSSAYRAISRGEPLKLEQVPIQYGDYAVWQQQRVESEDFNDDLAFWEENLRGAPELLELPSDRMRPSVQSHRGARQRFRFNAALTEALHNCSRQEKTSLFTVFAAALKTLLYRYTGSEDILLGIPIAERERQELQSVVGFLVHTQALRTRVSGDITFRELLARVQRASLEMYSHREVPFDQVVSRLRPERSLSHSPLFQVMINWRDQDQHLSFIGLDGLIVESLLSETRTSKFDLTLFLTDFGNEIWLEAEYNSDLFDHDRIVRMFGHYQTLLEGVVTAPDQRLMELPLLTDGERRQLLEWNATEFTYPRDKCIHQLYEMQAERTPDAIALVFGESEVTYRELNERANQLAHYLKKLGMKANDLVGICVERSIEMIVGVLGILKAGGAYVPLDPSYPQERLTFMMEDTRARFLVVQDSSLEKVRTEDTQLVCLNRDRVDLAGQSVENLRGDATPCSLAYVIYTSGSTGKPKGVAIAHYNVVRLFQSTEQWFHFSKQDVWTLFHSFAFDFSVWEMWGALLYGGRLVIVPYLVSRSPEDFYDLLCRERVTVLNQTPSAFLQLIELETDDAKPKKLALRLVVFGGEALELSSLAQWFERHGDVCPQLVNMYGITETTVHVTYRPLKKVDVRGARVIGRSIPDLQLHILDQNLQHVPIGVGGEICVGGAGLARGYLNRPELTNAKFVSNPFKGTGEERLYRSGDLARYLTNGDIEYLGRIDQQVKIRGFRIELGEIESALRQHPRVNQCVVVTLEDQAGDKRLAAYIVPQDQHDPPHVDDLRELLKQNLPEHMVPAVFVMLDKVPLNQNGKLDRRALPTPDIHHASSGEGYIAPRTRLEESLAQIWSEVLGQNRVGVHDDFFALGGHSLQATRLITKVHKSLNYKLPVPVFFHNPTIEAMARVLLEKKGSEGESELIPLERGNSPGSLFFLAAEIGDFGQCRLARLLKAGPTSFGTVVPFSPSAGQEAGLNRVADWTSLQCLAAAHVALIRSCHRSGPCLLVGYCFGGVLAFEVAHQLQREGISVEMILLLDAHREFSLWQKLRVKVALRSRLTRLARVFKSAKRSSPADEEVRIGFYPPVGVVPYLDTIRNLRKNYRYHQLDSRAVLFRAHDSGPQGGKIGWGGLFARGLEIVDTPGDHDSLLQSPNLEELAMKIDFHLERLGLQKTGDSSMIQSRSDTTEVCIAAATGING